MLKLSFLELIIRGIPEDLVFFLAVYTFTKIKVEKKRYLISVIIQSIIVYLIRFLPIQNGADSILNLILLILLSVYVNEIEIIQAIKAGIIIMLCEFISEGINVFFIQFILKKDLNSIFRDPMLKILYSSPSLLIFACFVIIYYLLLWKRKELKNISYGKVDE
ncbi:hypothetical protein [Clostridium omnivorum]|uniref:Uncharacterized protein n=1 Tax=Clostridium omnivorum TaxID=1604902 RepID=A0ABQ5N5M8_9CLOT|nr:hypothetical protein [Clostridium sp. E14]GLC30508.1 hypothetical protein bsdE14_19180 [Clostridium sp. E14]